MRREPYLWVVVLWAAGLAVLSGRVDPPPVRLEPAGDAVTAVVKATEVMLSKS